jgi:Glycosyl transferase family 11.
MIISNIFGGLGNQMFQYAIGRYLSCVHQVPLKLDTMAFENYTLRKYRLGGYSVHADMASVSDITHVRFHDRVNILRALGTAYEYRLPYYRRSTYREPHFSYDHNILKCKSDVYLVGYWQSEKYFKDIETQIREDFTLLPPPDHRNAEMADIIQSCESVNLHVRRGDYISNPAANAYHGTCSPEYYKKAIHIIENRIQKPHFFIFSDDPVWVRENMNTGYPTTIVDINGPESDREDLRLMSLCKHHIIANSSFSWWGAWLSSNPDKMVIAPNKWFNDPRINTRDLVPSSWIRL